jgi:hypothetical protein
MAFICQGCGKAVARGERRFCSITCYHEHRKGQVRGYYKGHEPEEKTCVVCGTVFVAGGRGNPPRRQRFCSKECTSAGRYRRGARARVLTVAEAAYLAGILDGEGSIILYLRRDVVALRVVVANTNRALLDWIVRTVGVGDVYAQREATETHAAAWSWRCNAEAAETLLGQLRPYLRIKAPHADLALATQARLRDPAQKADRSWHLTACEQMRALNRRGPLGQDSWLAAGQDLQGQL